MRRKRRLKNLYLNNKSVFLGSCKLIENSYNEALTTLNKIHVIQRIDYRFNKGG